MAKPLSPKIKKNWLKGLVTRLEKESVPDASDCLNWQFKGDHIELRRGQVRMGTLIESANPATFVKTGVKYDGTEVFFWGYLQKLLYYDETTDDNVEISTDVLPALASGEPISVSPYKSIAGSFLFLSSPNSSIYKIAVANPESVTDLLQNTFRGYIKATLGRMFLWNRKNKYSGSDQTGLQLSSIDKDSLADYPFTSAEDVGTGDGSTTAFSGTLAFKATYPKQTCHFVRIAGASAALKTITAITAASSPTATTSAAHGLAVGDIVVFQDILGMTQLNKRIAVVLTVPSTTTFTFDIDTSAFTAYSSAGSVAKSELFIDDRSGILTGSLGGTGTINYTTGAWTVTFLGAVTNLGEVVADYYTEDATDADSGVTNSGAILDFAEGNATSIADSLYFPQADAGDFQNLGIIGDTIFCIHTLKTYALRLISTADITNLIYREKVGIPYFRATVTTGKGIYYLDNIDPKDPKVRLLSISQFNTEVIPKSVSDNLNLSDYRFDLAVMFEWGEYVCLACRTSDETVNNRLFMLNTIWNTWEVHNFRISDMDTYGGALLGADSGAAGVFKLFSGLADQNAIIENYFITGNDNYGKEGIKDTRRQRIMGMIGDDQQLDISYSIDNSPFVFFKSILGTGAYVDSSQRKVIGNTTLGEIIGGGQAQTDAIFASPYELEFQVNTARYNRIRYKLEAKGIGYISVSEFGPTDWRDKGRRLPVKYQE